MGIVGFIGVGLTIAGQIRTDRIEQRAHEQQEANHLRAALAVELQSISDEDKDYATKLQTGANVVIRTALQDTIFIHYIEKLSLLCPDEITLVYKAYYSQRQFIPLVAATLTPLPIPGYYTVKPANFKTIATFFDAFATASSFAASNLLIHEGHPDDGLCKAVSTSFAVPYQSPAAPRH